jgi:hypothetical protein
MIRLAWGFECRNPEHGYQWVTQYTDADALSISCPQCGQMMTLVQPPR